MDEKEFVIIESSEYIPEEKNRELCINSILKQLETINRTDLEEIQNTINRIKRRRWLNQNSVIKHGIFLYTSIINISIICKILLALKHISKKEISDFIKIVINLFIFQQ